MKKPLVLKLISIIVIMLIVLSGIGIAGYGEFAGMNFSANKSDSTEKTDFNVKTTTDGGIKVLSTKTDSAFTDEDRKEDVICMQIGKNLAIAFNKKVQIDSGNSQVVPYISGQRTLVPLRFVAETLGAEVLWEEGWNGCIIKKDGTEIKLTFGSAEFTVNGEKVTYDAPIETVYDRTMVPVRFISESLNYDVYWNELNQAIVVSPMDNPWVESREAETIALSEMLVTLLPFMQ